MKCPKCGYLGFEAVDRCRNCGYDFSLLAPQDIPDLPIRTEPPAEQNAALVQDLSLVDAALSTPLPWQLAADRERSFKTASRASDLPLFGGGQADDQPLITKPSPPRAPLAVRRATPEVPRESRENRERLTRPEPRAPLLDLSSNPATSEALDEGDSAPLAARAGAAAVDLAILAAIDAIVIYFTLQICGLMLAEVNILPKAPLAAFLLLQNGGYLVAFTAAGQTLGKMAAGIRVIPTRGRTLDVGHSLVRTLVWVALAAPAGLGFATALFSRERRGLHDYCAGTRVVRAV